MQSQSQIQDRQISNNIATVSKSHKTIHFRLKYVYKYKDHQTQINESKFRNPWSKAELQ